MTRPIEIFSLEGLALWAFTVVVVAAGILDFAYLIAAKRTRFRRWIMALIRLMDRFFLSFYRSAKLIPWILVALLISVLAPIYDMHTDIGWADAVLQDGGERVKGVSWPELLLNSHVRTLPTFIHVAQTAIVLFVLWVYSLFWNLLLRSSGRESVISRTRGTRWGYMAGFVAFVITPISYFLEYLGSHAELALRLPQMTG